MLSLGIDYIEISVFLKSTKVKVGNQYKMGEVLGMIKIGLFLLVISCIVEIAL